jgi:hypothetical protein
MDMEKEIMTTNFNNSFDLLLDFESLSVEALPLTSEQIEQAIEISNQIINQERQWKTYLNSLALFGFQSWLESRVPEMPINSAQCSLWQPKYSNVIEGVFNLEVNHFKICLIATGSMDEDVITIPRAVIDLPEYVAHFYVIVNVQDEQEEVNIKGFISYDKFLEHKKLVNLQPQLDWTYELSWDYFNSEPDDLILYLRCLEPNTIALPAITTNKLTDIRTIQRQLEGLIPQLQSPETNLWEILDWQTAIPLLTNPELLNWLYQVQTNQLSTAKKIETLPKLAVNVGLWLQDEIDKVAKNLTWTLFPPSCFAVSSMRFLSVINPESPTEEMERIITQLRNSGIDIPVEVGGAYRDFTLGSNNLRLYACTWMCQEQENCPEWSLLVVLGTQSGTQLPSNLCLQLKEEDTLLDEKIVEENSEDIYLYSRVIGELDEQFIVSITLANGETLVLPPFRFYSE